MISLTIWSRILWKLHAKCRWTKTVLRVIDLIVFVYNCARVFISLASEQYFLALEIYLIWYMSSSGQTLASLFVHQLTTTSSTWCQHHSERRIVERLIWRHSPCTATPSIWFQQTTTSLNISLDRLNNMLTLWMGTLCNNTNNNRGYLSSHKTSFSSLPAQVSHDWPSWP